MRRKIFASLGLLLMIPFSAFALSRSEYRTGIIGADKDYITVIAEGKDTDRKRALEGAYIDAVRLAVGAIISSKTELNNDELSENIIMHSRGVIEGFDVLSETEEGGLTHIYIRAKVHREILQDETKRYIEAQTVKADTGDVMDAHAKEVTTQAKQKSGYELLREVLETYGPENFLSVKLNPKILYDKTTKKPYIHVTEKFNEPLFRDKFLPKLRNALDGVAVKKTKQFYDDSVRKANQTLIREGYIIGGGLTTSSKALPYDYDEYSLKRNRNALSVIVPDNVSSFTLYEMPFSVSYSRARQPGAFHEAEYVPSGKIGDDNASMLSELIHFMQKMSRPFTYSITYLDKNEDVISVQAVKVNPKAFAVYRSFDKNSTQLHMKRETISFAPGFVSGELWRDAFLDTANYSGRYEVELDSDELQRLDSMKFEVIFD